MLAFGFVAVFILWFVILLLMYVYLLLPIVVGWIIFVILMVSILGFPIISRSIRMRRFAKLGIDKLRDSECIVHIQWPDVVRIALRRQSMKIVTADGHIYQVWMDNSD